MAPTFQPGCLGGARCVRKLAPLCLLAFWLAAGAGVRANESRLPAELQLKAVFLFNFAHFVDWPPQAFDHPGSPVVIGILGTDPFGKFIDEIVRGETVNGRSLVIARYRRASEIVRCHVLFVSASESDRTEQILATLRGKPVLTVCDWEDFARHGGMIRFITEHNHVRLRINLDSVREANLTVSSKLLRCAEAVSSHDQKT
jgi:uncharacterized protein DUF4154